MEIFRTAFTVTAMPKFNHTITITQTCTTCHSTVRPLRPRCHHTVYILTRYRITCLSIWNKENMCTPFPLTVNKLSGHNLIALITLTWLTMKQELRWKQYAETALCSLVYSLNFNLQYFTLEPNNTNMSGTNEMNMCIVYYFIARAKLNRADWNISGCLSNNPGWQFQFALIVMKNRAVVCCAWYNNNQWSLENSVPWSLMTLSQNCWHSCSVSKLFWLPRQPP